MVSPDNIEPNAANSTTIIQPTASRCQNCGSNEIEYDPNQGNSVCISCGAVLEESAVVSEITFTELGNGSVTFQGQFVSAERGRASSSSVFAGRRFGANSAVSSEGLIQESREQTLENGRRRINRIGTVLHMSEQHMDQAFRWLKLALQHQFTRGRRATSVCAACLYIVCRLEKTPHMLLDFSDVLQASVYELGGIFLRLIRLLNIQIPLIDPSFYVGRFAARLEFGEKAHQVTNHALRLVARMKRDWINTGRRPSGVCAAALILSARLHGFKRSNEEVARVVHICEATLIKRLGEFGATPSANLTPDEFEGVWLEQESDPPAYSKPVPTNRHTDALGEHVVLESPPLPPTPPPSVQPSPTTTATTRRKSKRLSEKEQAEQDSISDFEDDSEVENLIMKDPAEIAKKTQVWMARNGDYLEQLARKAAELEAQAADPKAQTKRKRVSRSKPSTAKNGSKEVPETAAEAAKLALSNKKFSKKINYEVLEKLLSEPFATKPSIQQVKNQ